LATSGLERSGVNDGTFWMDLTHFIMGFAIVDVCLANRGWHSVSLPNAFCRKASRSRVCRDMYRLTLRDTSPTAATLYVMALQPSKRGSRHGRTDRKVSYRPGDLSVVVVAVSAQGELSCVGGGLMGQAARGVSAALLVDPSATYWVIPYCLGTPPTAAETREAAPFTLRLQCSAALSVLAVPFGPDTSLPPLSPPSSASSASSGSSDSAASGASPGRPRSTARYTLGTLALLSLHHALLSLHHRPVSEVEVLSPAALSWLA
jgi:hypothetical protein